MNPNKNEVRDRYKKIRAEITAKSRAIAEREICQRLMGLYCKPENFEWLLYASLPEEISTAKIFEWLGGHGAKCFFPKVEKDQISFYEVDNFKNLFKGTLSLEPKGDSQKYDGKEAIALIPGLVFSNHGHRLGYGKGFYDKFLSTNPKLLKVGLAFNEQIFIGKGWPTEPHDQRMDSVVTPASIWSATPDTQWRL